jgi:hypothetical protein
MSLLTRILSASFVAAVLLAVPAHAETQWQKNHPRRTQVNSRLNNQNARIRQGERSGKLSKGQAHQLHEEDHAMRNQERAEAAEHGGHITKGEQRQLNREENAESRQIYNEKH